MRQRDLLDDVPVVYTVRVGYTSRRPVIPDQHTAHVQVVSTGHDGVDAMLAAAQMVACWPWCVMPTSTEVVAVEV